MTTQTRAIYILWNFRTGAMLTAYGPWYDVGPGGEMRHPVGRMMQIRYS